MSQDSAETTSEQPPTTPPKRSRGPVGLTLAQKENFRIEIDKLRAGGASLREAARRVGMSFSSAQRLMSSPTPRPKKVDVVVKVPAHKIKVPAKQVTDPDPELTRAIRHNSRPLVEAVGQPAISEISERAAGFTSVEILVRQRERVNSVMRLADRLEELLTSALSTPPETDTPAQRQKVEALNTLLAGKNDSLTSAITALKGLIETAVRIEGDTWKLRRLVGLNDVLPVEEGVTDQDGAVTSAPTLVGPGQPAPPMPEITRLSTDQLETLFGAAEVLEAARGRAPLPMPPTGPTIEGEVAEAS